MSVDIKKVIKFYFICIFVVLTISLVPFDSGTLIRLINSECIGFSLLKTMYFLSFSVIFSAAQRAPSNYAIEFYFTI